MTSPVVGAVPKEASNILFGVAPDVPPKLNVRVVAAPAVAVLYILGVPEYVKLFATVKSSNVALVLTILISPPVKKSKFLSDDPFEFKSPVETIKLFKFNVPAVRVNVLVEPDVRFPDNLTVPVPNELLPMVIGKSKVLFADVIKLVLPENDAKVVALVPAVNVPPEAGTVKLP